MAIKILEFLSAPFIFVAHISIYIASTINGNHYVLMEIQEADDGEEDK